MSEGRCKTCNGEGEIETGQTSAARCVDCAGTGKTGGEPPNPPLTGLSADGQSFTDKDGVVWPTNLEPNEVPLAKALLDLMAPSTVEREMVEAAEAVMTGNMDPLAKQMVEQRYGPGAADALILVRTEAAATIKGLQDKLGPVDSNKLAQLGARLTKGLAAPIPAKLLIEEGRRVMAGPNPPIRIPAIRTRAWDDVKADMRPEVRQAAEGRVAWALMRCARPTCGHQRIDHSHGIIAPKGLAASDIPADLPLVYSSDRTEDGKGACLITCGCREFQEPGDTGEAWDASQGLIDGKKAEVTYASEYQGEPGFGIPKPATVVSAEGAIIETFRPRTLSVADLPAGAFPPGAIVKEVYVDGHLVTWLTVEHAATAPPPRDQWFVRREDSLAAEGAFDNIVDAFAKAGELLAWRQAVYVENDRYGVKLDPAGASVEPWTPHTPHFDRDSWPATEEYKHRGGFSVNPGLIFYGLHDPAELCGPGSFFEQMDRNIGQTFGLPKHLLVSPDEPKSDEVIDLTLAKAADYRFSEAMLKDLEAIRKSQVEMEAQAAADAREGEQRYLRDGKFHWAVRTITEAVDQAMEEATDSTDPVVMEAIWNQRKVIRRRVLEAVVKAMPMAERRLLEGRQEEITRLQRERVGDAERIGREMCRAESAEAELAKLKQPIENKPLAAMAREGAGYVMRAVRHLDRTRALAELSNRGLFNDRQEGEMIPEGLTVQYVGGRHLIAQAFLKNGAQKCRMSLFEDSHIELEVIEEADPIKR